MQLSADGRETLEDALRIYTETAGDAQGRAEREAAVRALETELREPDPTPQWLEPTLEKVREAQKVLAERNAVAPATRAVELLDELQEAAGALVDEIATRRAIARGEIGIGAALTLRKPPSSGEAALQQQGEALARGEDPGSVSLRLTDPEQREVHRLEQEENEGTDG